MKAIFKGGPYDGQDGVCGQNGAPKTVKMPHGEMISVYERDETDPFILKYSKDEHEPKEPKP